MGKFRSKLKGQSKGKRWAKGQSSSCNPETKKYRDLAKSRFFQVNLGPSNLTAEALKKHDSAHNQLQSNTASDSVSESLKSTTFNTYDTFASDWSACTNPSFGKLMTTFRSNSVLHKDMLAILAAATETIKSEGGNETSTEYFGCLMTALEKSDTDELKAAILSLLAMGLKSVKAEVLCFKFSDATTLYLNILSQYSQCDNNVIIRSVMACLSILLRAQPLSAWSSSYTIKVFDSILAFVNHSKPKIRKAAQHNVSAVLNASCFMLDGTAQTHPAGKHVAEFCIKQIESGVGTSGGQTTTLHLLALLKDIIRTFPKAQIKSCCETLLKIMTLNNPLINSCSLEVIHSLFSGQQTVVSAQMNDQLIAALYDYQPSNADFQPTLAWITVMKQAHIHLSDVDTIICLKRLPRVFKTFVELWLTDRNEITTTVTLALDDLIKDCIGAILDNPALIKANEFQLKQIFETLETGLTYQYHNAWNHVLHLIVTLFNVAGASCQDMLIPFLVQLSSLRDSYKFSYNNELEFAVGAAIRNMGPEIVLKIIPLINNDSKVLLDRSWLLPVLKDNIKHSSLDYFNTNIRNLAENCEKQSKLLLSKGDGINGHSMELFSSQLWSLFPSFCNSPSDIINFKKIAQVIGLRISNDKNLRLPLMAGLRKLINSKLKDVDNNCDDKDIKELARFAKNYVPIFFNIYTQKPAGTDEEGQRLAALDTIKVYLTIAPNELRQTLFNEALKRLMSNEEEFIRESLFDLIRLLAVYQSKDDLERLYDECIKQYHKSKEQKKAYRLLEDICASDLDGCKQFVYNNKKKIKKLMLESLEKTAASSKAARLRCLKLLIFKTHRTIDPENKLVQDALAESVMCMKDINEKCRNEAQMLLLAIGEELLKSKHGRDQYLGALIAGFTGSQQMVIGTILALASLVHHFTGSLGADNLQLVLKTNCQLMQASTREIVQACFSFLKVYITRLPIAQVQNDLSTIVNAICRTTDDCKRHFRIKIRNILDRLIRKFGCDTISKLVPQNDVVMHKRLRNLRKMNARKKRRQSKDDNDEEMDIDFDVNAKPKTIEAILADSDSDIDDDDEDKNSNNKQKTRNRKTNAWIQDDMEDIVDFTDASAVGKIRATNPAQSNQTLNKQKINKDKNRGFKTAADGRLVITEDDSDDSDDNKINFDSDSDNETNDAASAADTLKLGAGKRKRTASDNVSMFSGASSSRPPMKYQAGGSGIHRPIGKKLSNETGSIYKSRKAAGDVKRKGKPDPYAYVPLKRNTLNKRKRLKNKGQFKNIVRGAAKGAKKGMKNKKNRH